MSGEPGQTEAFDVWCCELSYTCKGQAFALHQGLGWGKVPPKTNEWRKWHDRVCGGKLIQITVATEDEEVKP